MILKLKSYENHTSLFNQLVELNITSKLIIECTIQPVTKKQKKNQEERY